ncbi:MAG: molybdenum cofactor guanylyltransferase MobA [Pseudomonadota bacterium]
MQKQKDPIIGAILAGGLSRRMGGVDKALKKLGGVPMLATAIDRLSPQVDRIIVNTGNNPDMTAFELPVISDNIEGHAGPLAGVEAAMDWAIGNARNCTHVVTVAVDTPFFPNELVLRLRAAVSNPETLVVASSNDHLHPAFSLWPVALHADLCRWLENEKNRKVSDWVQRHTFETVDFPFVRMAGTSVDPFFNANTPEDFETAERLLRVAVHGSEERI